LGGLNVIFPYFKFICGKNYVQYTIVDDIAVV
jgi:hypothetical protein